jgi:predicted DNA-binding protein with PD1-like motif
MIVFESTSVRHLVGRLDRGAHIHEALGDLAREHGVSAGWITALGAFEWVELCEYDQRRRLYRPARRFETPCEILSLVGNLSFKDGEPFAHVHATLSRETDNGVSVVGGHLVDGAVFACELRVECYDDLVLGRELDGDTGLALWKGAVASASAPAEPPTKRAPRLLEGEPSGQMSWAEVADRSRAPAPSSARRRFAEGPTQVAVVPDPLPAKQRTSEDEFFEEPIPAPGDWVDHQVFGLCKVLSENDDGGLVLRLPNGRHKAIRLDVLRVLPARTDGGRRIYPVRPRKR